MPILVVGGTGTVGSQVVRALLASDADVQVLTRKADSAKQLPDGAQAVIGDLLIPSTVRSVFRGVDGVFMLNAVSPTETHEGLLALNGMCEAGIKRLVYLSVHHLDRAPHLPHFGAKLAIESVVRRYGIPYTILRPNNFFQNDYWFKDALLQHGIYPQPIGDIGLSRVDVRDIAEIAAKALLEDGHEGQTYDLVGPDVLSGPRVAEIWSQALGKPVRYGGNDLDRWEQQALQSLPDWMAFDFRLMYAFFQAQGFAGTPADVARLSALLGHPPRSFAAFAEETAAQWRA